MLRYILCYFGIEVNRFASWANTTSHCSSSVDGKWWHFVSHTKSNVKISERKTKTNNSTETKWKCSSSLWGVRTKSHVSSVTDHDTCILRSTMVIGHRFSPHWSRTHSIAYRFCFNRDWWFFYAENEWSHIVRYKCHWLIVALFVYTMNLGFVYRKINLDQATLCTPHN